MLSRWLSWDRNPLVPSFCALRLHGASRDTSVGDHILINEVVPRVAATLLKVHVQKSMTLNSFKSVNANGTLPCLGSDGVQPYRSVLLGEVSVESTN